MQSGEVELQNTRPALSGGRYFFSGAYPEFPAHSQPFLAPVRDARLCTENLYLQGIFRKPMEKAHKLTYFTNKVI